MKISSPSPISFLDGLAPCRFFGGKSRDLPLLIFLPFGRRNKSIFPYYYRISWAVYFLDRYHVLYISDPYQCLPENSVSQASWFLGPSENFLLDSIGDALTNWLRLLQIPNAVLYSSSTGGFWHFIY